MKFSWSRSSSRPPQQQGEREPFFQKQEDREGAFFSTKKTADQPFFSPATIQPKLNIGRPGDKYEREAEANELAVGSGQWAVRSSQGAGSSGQMTVGSGALQAKCAECGQEEPAMEGEHGIQQKPIFDSAAAPPDDEQVQRKCAACAAKEQEKVQAKADYVSKPAASPGLESRLNGARGGGSPLPKETRAEMEGAFGADFTGVRVHSGSDAVQMNRELGAQAFTHGRDVYFGAGKYDVGSSEGKGLLAHELTHVVQQNAAQTHSIQRDITDSADSDNDYDAQAEEAEKARKLEIENYFKETYLKHYLKEAETADKPEEAVLNKRIYYLLDTFQMENDITDFSSEEEMDDVLEDIVDPTVYASTEQATADYISDVNNISGNIEVLMEHPAFGDYADGFPETWQNKLRPLIMPKPSQISAADDEARIYRNWWQESLLPVPASLFQNGLPYNFEESLSLWNFRLIQAPSRFPRFFTFEPDFSNLRLQAEDKALFLSHTRYWKQYVLSQLNKNSYLHWAYGSNSALSRLRRPGWFINMDDYQRFKAAYPDGLHTLSDFAPPQEKQLYSVIEAIALIYGKAEDGYSLYSLREALTIGMLKGRNDLYPGLINDAIKYADQKIGEANAQIEALSGDQRLEKADAWASQKGFYGSSMELMAKALKDNAGEIAKDAAIEWGAKTIISLHPVGRALVLAKEIFDLFSDTVSAVSKIDMARDDARKAHTVADLQRASANLAFTYTTEGTTLLLNAIDAISSVKSMKKGGVDPHAKPKKNIAPDNPSPFHLSLEMLNVQKARPGSKINKTINKIHYVEEVITDGHTWRRRAADGGWCRFTKANCFDAQQTKGILKETAETVEETADYLFSESEFDNYFEALQDGKIDQAAAMLRMQPHRHASANRQANAVSGRDVQSMHGAPQSTMRTTPGYVSDDAFTILAQTTIHTEIDAHWKSTFRAMAHNNPGKTQITAREMFDVVSESINRSSLTDAEKFSMIQRLSDEIFVEYGLSDTSLVRLPYS